jgi:erythromycin esterase
MNRRIPGVVLVVTLSLGTIGYAGTEPGADRFLQWAGGNLVSLQSVRPQRDDADLAPLGEMVGNASIVALSEAVHAGAEPLEFRNRVAQYLVREKGFTVVAIESGLVEGRQVHDYVAGKPGELSTVVENGISWTFDRIPQNLELVRWLREYNADPGHPSKVSFYGFDVPGSPGNPMANRGVDTALRDTLDFIAKVDSEAATAFTVRLADLLPRLRFDPQEGAVPGYTSLDSTERDALTGAIADLVGLMERKEREYTAHSSAADYAWAYRAAIGARQVDTWLRHIPLGWQAGDSIAFFAEAHESRDRAQADNIDWIIQREGSEAKVLVFASRAHISTAPISSRFGDYSWGPRATAGTFLRDRHGDKLISIGNLAGGGRIACAGFSMDMSPEPEPSIDGLVGSLDTPLFLLDLRSAPADVSAWLGREQVLWDGSSIMQLRLSAAFDLLFYVHKITPACPI